MVGKKGIIIGGGIAGLTAAVAMQRLRMSVTVYESAVEIKAMGTGIWMAPNAMQVFDKLGIADKVNAGGVPLNRIEVVDKDFKAIMRTNQNNIRERFGYTTTAIRRSTLQQILLAEVGAENVVLSKLCTGIKEDADGVTVAFADGTTVTADFVIAADGIHSVIRGQLFGPVKFSETGKIVWRGLSKLQLRPDLKKSIIEGWHGGLRFGFSEVADGVVDWFAVEAANTSERHTDGIKAGLLETFKEFSYPVDAILGCADEGGIIRNVLTDFSPLPAWSKGKVCLIGDAAHASTPYMGQGGCQAVEDALVIAQCLHMEDTVEAAFALLQKKRRRKAIEIVKTSRMMGRIGFMQGGLGALRNAAIRATPMFVIERNFVRVYSLEM